MIARPRLVPVVVLAVSAGLTACSASRASDPEASVPRAAGSGPDSREAPRVAEPVVYELGSLEAEVISLVETVSGKRLYVTSPGEACDGRGDASSLSVLDLPGHPGERTSRYRLIELGLGEVTSVAAHPDGELVLVARKDGHRPDTAPGALLLLRGSRVEGAVPVGVGPDCVDVTPDGRFAVVACEGQPPDDDCAEDHGNDDTQGSIHIVDLGRGVAEARTAAVVSGEALFAARLSEHPDRARTPQDIEPEFVATSPDGSLALVTLQEQSAVVAIDLQPLREPDASDDPETLGRSCLGSITLLPHDLRDDKGQVRGVHPDGIAISPDGTFAVAANEAHSKARSLQGITVLDLTRGAADVRVTGVFSIFELDSTLRPSAVNKVVRKAKRPKTDEVRLPRLDPEGVAIARVGDKTVAALAIERRALQDGAGSVLLLDVTGVLEGARPRKIDRKVVGANAGARPETLRFSADGRFIFVASERDGGTVTVLEIET